MLDTCDTLDMSANHAGAAHQHFLLAKTVLKQTKQSSPRCSPQTIMPVVINQDSILRGMRFAWPIEIEYQAWNVAR